MWFPNEVIGHNVAKNLPKSPLDSYYVPLKVSNNIFKPFDLISGGPLSINDVIKEAEMKA